MQVQYKQPVSLHYKKKTETEDLLRSKHVVLKTIYWYCYSDYIYID